MVTWLTPTGTVNDERTSEKPPEAENVQVTGAPSGTAVLLQDAEAPAGGAVADSKPADASPEPRATATPIAARRRVRKRPELDIAPLGHSPGSPYVRCQEPNVLLDCQSLPFQGKEFVLVRASLSETAC